MDWKTMYRSEIGGRLTDFRQQESYTDVKIKTKTGSDVFHCHKVILAAMSPFFDATFQSGMLETISGVVSIPYDCQTTRELLTFIYTGNCDVSSDIAYQLYHAANYFQIPSLLKVCEDTLRAGISAESCFHVWKTAKLHKCYDIAENARTMVLHHFDKFLTEDDLIELDFEEIVAFLKDPFLNCSDVGKCRAALQWIAVDMEDRQERTQELISCLLSKASVNGRILSTEIDNMCTFIKCEDPDDLKALQSTCKELFADLNPDDAHSGDTSNLALCVYSDESLVILGGVDGDPETSLRRFSYRQQKWFDLAHCTKDPGYRFAACALDGKLYVTGGTNDGRQLMEYDSKQVKWRRLREMFVDRQDHAMGAASGKGVYVLAGVDGQKPVMDVHVFDPDGSNWTRCGQVARPVKAPAYATSNNKIFLLGGSNLGDGEQNKPSSMLQYFEIKTGFSCILQFELPFDSKLHKVAAASVGGQLFAVAHRGGKGPGDVYLIHENKKAEKKGEINGCPTREFGCVAYGGKLAVIGGQNEKYQASKDMIQFNQENGEAVCLLTKLPVPLRKFFCSNLIFT